MREGWVGPPGRDGWDHRGNNEGGMGGTTRVGPPRQQLLTATGNIYRIGNIGKKNLVFYSNFNVPTHFQNLQ